MTAHEGTLAAPVLDDARLVALPGDRAVYRRQVIFQCFKWDPQVEDANTISDHACILAPETAAYLATISEKLASESIALERAVSRRPDLLGELGLGSRLRRALAAARDGASVRVMRFDFHPTANGWSLSEVNSDVPGGFAEAGPLARLVSAQVSGAAPAGDPAAALVAAFAERLAANARIAFVYATSYSDDRQVMLYLAQRFSEIGAQRLLIAPDHVRWRDDGALSIAEAQQGPIDAIVRFYPAEWLADLPGAAKWRGYFEAPTLMCNPARALISQSKRAPLLWNALDIDVPAWRSVLPETRDVRAAPYDDDASWLLKPAFGRVGEGVAWKGLLDDRSWRQIKRRATTRPLHWIAQRRFHSRALSTASGPKHLCVGVFTVDGRASGFYGRLSTGPVTDKKAEDVAVLVSQRSGIAAHAS